jgi:hypothetical protein
MRVFPRCGEVLPRFGEIAAMQRVILLLDGEQFLHRWHMVILEDPSSKSKGFYVLVAPKTLILVFTVGLHLFTLSFTSRMSQVTPMGIQ